jgi:1,4-alpha-glucan branching enzyme
MGIPDFWIKTLKLQKDEDWSVDQIYHEHTNRRRDEKIISYCESHDQALVGDKTIAFWLMDAEMYWNMAKDRRNLIIDRGIALHKMIRMVTCLTARGGYLNFMGNEFGHPEWIDFPREGNGWSFHCARRQWNLVDDQKLCYHYLGDFDQGLITLARKFKMCAAPDPERFWSHCDDHILGIKKNDLYVLFNFHPNKSFADYAVEVPPGKYTQIFNTDNELYGGLGRIPDKQVHVAQKREYAGSTRTMISLYLPARTALVLQRMAN